MLLLLTIDCEQHDESIGLISTMLVKHLTLNVMLINELMLLLCLARLICSEAFDFTQYHWLHWSWCSLYAESYPDAPLLCDISTRPTVAPASLLSGVDT